MSLDHIFHRVFEKALFCSSTLNDTHTRLVSLLLSHSTAACAAPNSTRASAAAQQLRLPSDAARLEAATDVALFFALWGEAANLRLVPEALCFLFHKMSGELRRADALGVEPVRSEGAFLKCVVQPVYKVRGETLGGASESGLRECMRVRTWVSSVRG